MGTTSEKLAYLNETKADIKSALIEQDQPVEDTDTFRSYADKVRAISRGIQAEVLEEVPITLDFTDGNQTVSVPEGMLVKSAVIQQPENLIPENIAKDVNIAGIVGTHEGSGAVEGTVTMTFCNYDGTVLFERLVFIGDNCPDPITQGKIEKPTRESTAQYDYTFDGWSLTEGGNANDNALVNLTEDRTVYASYTSAKRYYTARFFDGETLRETLQVGYGETANPSTAKEGYVFEGWTPSDLTIYSDTDFYGTWSELTGWYVLPLPTDMPTKYVRGGSFNNDGTRCALAVDGTALYVYDTTTIPWTRIETSATLPNAYGTYSATYSPDGTRLSVGQYGGKLLVFDATNDAYTQLNSRTIGSSSITYVTYNLDGTQIACGANSDLYILDATSLSSIQAIDVTGNYGVQNMRFSPDGTKLAVTVESPSSGDILRIYDVTNNYALLSLLPSTLKSGDYPAAKGVAYNQEGTILAVSYKVNSTPYLKFYDTTTTPYTELDLLETTQSKIINDMRYLKNDSELLCVGNDISPNPTLYDTTSGKYQVDSEFPVVCTSTYSLQNCVIVSPDEKRVVIGGGSPYIAIVGSN